MYNNKCTIIIAPGDSEQLKPVSEITNQEIDQDEYMDSVMYQLFKHEILQKKANLNHIKDIENLEEIVKY